eukprot:CAMPEP_0117450086 /NCGR_PEP_ID=MMETSP0759-20121206/8283_1 /TAXON_ID=63605 /ORGANISM="Percolomonas cosmopolitus, Strain WS" /LENGTH=177 /DNA_ID=CAMNT_0005242589 /DNA_START=8 /DNA_END=541 /DNA_ORIENTATION=-
MSRVVVQDASASLDPTPTTTTTMPTPSHIPPKPSRNGAYCLILSNIPSGTTTHKFTSCASLAQSLELSQFEKESGCVVELVAIEKIPHVEDMLMIKIHIREIDANSGLVQQFTSTAVTQQLIDALLRRIRRIVLHENGKEMQADYAFLRSSFLVDEDMLRYQQQQQSVGKRRRIMER